MNINNFIINSDTEINSIFYSCYNLILLNFSNFNDIYNTNLIQEMNKGINQKLLFCLNINPAISISDNNYSGFCQSNICGYEYNNTCYKSCPKKTNVLSNISYLCQDLNCEKEGKIYNSE